VILIVLIIGATLVVPGLTSYWLKREIEQRLDVKIGGRISPKLFRSSFMLEDVTVDWDDKLKVASGKVDVQYDWLSLVAGDDIRIAVQSDDLAVELLGVWAKVGDMQNVNFSHFFADLSGGKEGIRQIHSLDANSPTLKFKIEASDSSNRSLNPAT